LTATIVSLFRERVRRDGERSALRVKRGGQFVALDWNALARDARRAAVALRRLGVEPGDRVVQASENRYEWIIADLAVHLARGVHVAVHATLSGPQIAYQIADSGARLVLVSGPEQLQKLPRAEGLPPGLTFVSFEPCAAAGESARLFADLMADVSEADGRSIEAEAAAHTTAGDLATILYTSGTTGEPKGVMLSHGNLASNALAALAAFGVENDDLKLCWLPLSHIFARTSDLYTWIGGGHEMALAESRDTLLADCATVHPTVMNGVPYFYDKVFRWLRDQGRADEPGALRAALGGRMRHCCSGGAALADHVAEFFARQGVPLVQGYGLTESSPVITVCSAAANRIGSVGRAIAGVEVRIADDGEILTRGPHVMLGYWNQPTATAETIRDGWLVTGDLGRLEDGFLRITGRKKELLVTAAGKNIAPAWLEGLLTEDPLIAQAMIVGDGRNYLAALIVPNGEALAAEIRARGIELRSAAEALVHPAVRELYAERINRRLGDSARCEQVGKFTLLPRGFSIESDELTPTLKLRRGVISRNFSREIEAMYAG